MQSQNSLNLSNGIFFKLKSSFKKLYKNSNFYEKRISKTFDNNFEYKPSPHLLSSIIKYQKKKYKIEDFATEAIWKNNISSKDFKKLNNFFWFFSLDLKSSKETTQSIILNWINKNEKFDENIWEFNITAKRIIAWLSNHQLTYEDSNEEYRLYFNHMLQKQTNHLLNEIKNLDETEEKLIGCAAIILTGLAYKDEKNYLDSGLNILKNLIKNSLDKQGFPKSRNIQNLVFYLKYLIIIREWFKESQNPIPEYVDETIYYLGSSYAFIWQNIKQDIFFNGNYSSNHHEFDQYLKRFGYTFNKAGDNFLIQKDLKIENKNIVFEKNYWKISASHNGYFKKFKLDHHREIEFYPEQFKFIGHDKIVRKDPDKQIKFDIRFHLHPDSKVMKTQNNKFILIQLEDEGWQFSCDNYDINIDNGLYFGNKNSYQENQNIFISGMSNESEQIIKWEISKI